MLNTINDSAFVWFAVVHILFQVGEGSLQYAEVFFEDVPTMQEVVIHGIGDKTVYSDIDFMAQHVAKASNKSESDSESDDDFMYVDGIENFVEKRENSNL